MKTSDALLDAILVAVAISFAACVAFFAMCAFFVPYALIAVLVYMLWTQHPDAPWSQTLAIVVTLATVFAFFFHGKRVVVNVTKKED